MQTAPTRAARRLSPPPEALIFDVFGTCADWRRSVARAVARQMPGIDAERFADAWRAEYDPAMAPIRDGRRAYVPLDILHRENLDRVARRLGLRPPDPDALARAWERLDPWPDVVPGLKRIRAQRIIAPCSNGSIAMMTRLARHAGLPWDCILGADLARDYKPAPAVYRAACAALQLAPRSVMMVAAHHGDLHAARAAGLATAFVPRPEEHGPDSHGPDSHGPDSHGPDSHGPDKKHDIAPDPGAGWDIVATDFGDLAAQLGRAGP